MKEKKKYIFISCNCDPQICNNMSISELHCEGQRIFDYLKKELPKHKIPFEYKVNKINIFGLNTYRTIIKIFPDNIVYVNVALDDVPEIIEKHFMGGKIVKKFILQERKRKHIDIGNIPFYHNQYRIVLRNSGLIDPENIEDYIKRKGYIGLSKVLSELSSKDVIDEMKVSGLRGRGGGGFPTWMKWNFARESQSDIKYVICNADEGDPGAYMDRSVLEGDPHSVLEGMIIAAYAIQATQGYIYCRAEYPLAIKRLEKAISDAKSYGFLGKNILGTNFSFDIEIRLGAGAFVCGEETALLASVEGNRGVPRSRPPFPTQKGLWGEPTVINNVETLANIPVIFLKGGQWYSSIGTDQSKGTKVFALTGKVKSSGLLEVPMGTTLREIIFDIGQGLVNKEKKFKAAQTGGPSGGVIPFEHIDVPISYESLSELGSIMGSGGLIVMDETDCIVDVVKFYLQFTVDESCGKCTPCRVGGTQLLSLLEQITKGKAKEGDIELIRSIGHTMKNASLCGLGITASNPVMSSLKYFYEEYMDHIISSKCSAKKCKELVSYTINIENCIGCTLCAKKCPANCISGSPKKAHVIDISKCVKCGECFAVCKFNAVNQN